MLRCARSVQKEIAPGTQPLLLAMELFKLRAAIAIHRLYALLLPKTSMHASSAKSKQSGTNWSAGMMICVTRSEPAFFDELAMSMAEAVAHKYLDLEFNASHQGNVKPEPFHDFHYQQGHRRHGGRHHRFHQYEGWTFYFRASNEARFASKYPKLYWFEHEPGLNRTNIERPRTEWVFQCPHSHLQWEEPETVKALWRDKFPQIDFDVVALDGDGTSWERRRDGEVVSLLGAMFETQCPGRIDLDEIPEGVK